MSLVRACWWLATVCTAAIVALPLGGCRKSPADLVIVSPHNAKIEEEFENAFRAWHQEKFGTAPKLEWRDIGGTTSITKYLLNLYRSADSSGIDVYFGGGAPDHKLLTSRGIDVPVKLPPEILEQLPATIGGIREYDPEGHWYGAAISFFGIVYNAKLLKEAGLPLPTKWDDLADPRMYDHIAAAKASESGSARAAYDMVIQSAPDWPAGWAKLLRIFANCKKYTPGASDIPVAVANGQILAGAAIDFYAYDQIAQSGPDVGFAAPKGTTAFTPDPISMLKGAPHPEMAKRFIEFVLSERAQKLWCLPHGTPGGPVRYDLYRHPIRKDVYADCGDRMLKPLLNPFQQELDFRLDERAAGVRISRLLGPLMDAAAVANHGELTRAWKAVIDAGMPADLLAELTALPANLATEAKSFETAEALGDSKQKELITSEWKRYFRDLYSRVAHKAAK